MKILQPSWAWTPEGILEDPVVTLDDGYILGCSTSARHPGEHVERLPGCLLLPGLVNAHSHAFQRAFRGHVQNRDAARGDFWTWREAMYRVAGALDPDQLGAVCRLAFLEMVESGVTEVGEFHYLHRDPAGRVYADPDLLAHVVIDAARAVGLRITLLRVAYHRAGPGEALRPEQARFRADTPDEVLAAVARLSAHPDPHVRAGLAPHSIRAVPPAWLPELATYDGIVHAHVAEQPAEVAACERESGCSPLRLLADAGLVTDRFGAVHLTFPSPGDVDVLAGAGGTIVVCPTTELDLGDGFLPVEARQRCNLALGSDSHATIDLWHEARTLELHGRALANRRHVITPPDDDAGLAARILRAATADGARCLGSRAGEIRAGAPADLVAIDLGDVAAAGMPPLEAAAFAAHPGWVRRVWVGGEPVVRDGRHADHDRIVADAVRVIRAVV